MQQSENNRILVGVAPRGDNDAALEYAAAEALRRGIGIHLVLVLHPQWPGPDGLAEFALLGDELVKVDTALLVQCEGRLETWTQGVVPVTTEVAHGAVVPCLVAAMPHAALVVLQHHRMARPHHLPTASVTNGVASRGHAPVLAVPDGWHEFAPHSLPVVAAIENATLSWAVADTALATAARCGSEARLLRAWSYADDLALNDPTFRTANVPDWEAHLRESLESEFDDLRTAYPEVRSSVAVVHGQPAWSLATETSRARLMVVGRHQPTLPIGSHLGPVTRAVLTHGACPVMVVDTRRT